MAPRLVVVAMLVATLLVVLGRAEYSNNNDDQIITLLGDDVGESGGVVETSSDAHSVSMHAEAEFQRFVTTHSKKYTKEEYPKRLAIYKDNLDFVRRWNSEMHGFSVGMNAMADLSEDEFANSYLNQEFEEAYLSSMAYKSSASYAASKRASSSSSSRRLMQDDDDDESEGGKYDVRWHKNTGSQPEAVDWSSKGVLTNINNQAKCFACYAFSACGAIEAAVHINGGKLVKLSAQQIVDCSDEYRNHRCKGGTMVKSYKYIADNGLMRDTDYGYNTILNSSPQCKQTYSKCKYDSSQTQQGVVGYVNIQSGSETDIMNAVATRPVSAAIDAHHRPFKLYSSGVFSLGACTNHLTHGLLIVGYGEEGGKPYWKVKNSWGETWGNSGYGKVSRGDNMCSIADWVNYPIVDDADANKLSTVRSLSELGGSQDEPDTDAPAQQDQYQPSDSYESYPSNAGFETPWNALRLQESGQSNATKVTDDVVELK
jgi:C1A family cysteine protease